MMESSYPRIGGNVGHAEYVCAIKDAYVFLTFFHVFFSYYIYVRVTEHA